MFEWDDGPEMAPEEVLRRSARPRAGSALEAALLAEDQDRASVPGVRAALRRRWHGWRHSSWGRRWSDRVVYWQERWYQMRHGTPSEGAWEEALAYYGDRYQAQGPNPEAFARLLRRRGVPDWANPFPEGDPRHYAYHPQGLMAADVNVLLEGLQADWGAEWAQAQESVGLEPMEAWPTIGQTLEHNARQAQSRTQAHRQAARLCWAQVLHRADALPHLSHEVHRQNLQLLTLDVLMHVPLHSHDLPRLIQGAIRLHLLAVGSGAQWEAKIMAGRQRLASEATPPDPTVTETTHD